MQAQGAWRSLGYRNPNLELRGRNLSPWLTSRHHLEYNAGDELWSETMHHPMQFKRASNQAASF